MDIRFQTAKAHTDAELAERARRCIHSGLLHRSSHVDYIEVKLGDAAGRRPHQDSYCIMRVKLHGTPAATVVDIGADAFSAIDRAADRVCRLTEAQLRLSGSPQGPTGRTDRDGPECDAVPGESFSIQHAGQNVATVEQIEHLGHHDGVDGHRSGGLQTVPLGQLPEKQPERTPHHEDRHKNYAPNEEA